MRDPREYGVVEFDENGVCDHCRNFENNIKPYWKPKENRFDELEEIAELSNSKVFDGKSDLLRAFKEVRGYN